MGTFLIKTEIRSNDLSKLKSQKKLNVAWHWRLRKSLQENYLKKEVNYYLRRICAMDSKISQGSIIQKNSPTGNFVSCAVASTKLHYMDWFWREITLKKSQKIIMHHKYLTYASVSMGSQVMIYGCGAC